MDFIDKIKQLAAKIPQQLDYCQTEEATKNAWLNMGFWVFWENLNFQIISHYILYKKSSTLQYIVGC